MNDKAITPYEKLKDLVSLDQTKERFKEVLGERAPAFLASILSTVASNDYLRECDPNSIMVSAMKAAVLNLPVDPNIGFAYIIPYKDHGRPVAQFQMGYKGFIQLALRSGMYKLLNVTELYQGEEVKVDRLTGKVVLSGSRTGDEVTGYVAYFKLSNGFEKFAYMSREQVEAHAKKYSKSYGRDTSPWSTHFDAMAKKTVLKALISKFGILSIDMQHVFDEDVEPEEVFPTAATPQPGEVIEGEFVPPPFEDQTPAPEFDYSDMPDPTTGFVSGPPPADLAEQVVAAGLSENVHAARKTLEKCTIEPTLEWFRNYRGWRDLGGSTAQAADKANKGMVPE